MSLRLRAVLITGLALVVLWLAAAGWMMAGVRANLGRTLDERLAMSARMVSGLLERAALPPDASPAHWADAIRVSALDGVACEVRTPQGQLLAHTGEGSYSTAESLPAGYSTRTVDGQSWRVYVLDDAQGFQIMTADQVDRRGAITRSLMRATGVPFLIAVVGGLLALWIGIGRGLAPLGRLQAALRARATDDTTPVSAAHAPAELRPVIAALNGLLDRVAGTLASQRAFTDAAAHELRSPLTAIDTHLQVVRLTEGEQALRSLQQAEEGVRRLRHTLDQMMALARTEAPVRTGDACDSVAGVVREVVQGTASADAARITLDVGGGDGASPVPRTMLATALRNLLDNALRYSPAQSPVEVTLALDSAAHEARVEIADRGPGLDAAQAARVGQRFWRGDQGRQAGAGSGLGVSIVRAIAGRFGGSVTFEPRLGGGLVATLSLPIVPDGA